MKRSILVTATSILMLSMGASAASANDAHLRSIIEGRYAEMKVAMAKRDAQAISKLLAPNFESVDVSGQTESAAQMTAEVTKLPPDPNKVSHTTILSIRGEGDVALVDQRYDMKTTKAAQNGSQENVELIAVSSDIWVKSGHAWLMERTVTKQMDYLVNGKTVMHKTSTAF